MVVVAGVPKPKAVDAVVLAPNEPNENPDVPFGRAIKSGMT